MSLETFTQAYIECALWAEMDNSDPNTGGDPLDRNYSADDIAPETLTRIQADCAKFYAANSESWINAYPPASEAWSDDERAGHDFWLTRNGHGAGFWDRGMGDIGDTLTDACKVYREVDLYVGDDGLIYS